MKTIFRGVLLGVLGLTAAACDKGLGEFLDKAPGVDVTEATIFSSRQQLETFVAGTYRIGIHSVFSYNDAALIPTSRTFTINAAITDEAEADGNAEFFHTSAWNVGNITPVGGLVASEDYRYYIRWTAIRNCNTILERINDVPGLEAGYRNQVIGEARFIRALNYSEMLKRYGGVPILDKRVSGQEASGIRRSSVEDVVNFIVKDCDEAVALLPATYPSTFRGRATKTAALMLKARTLLIAASPLFNSATPYLDLGADNKLICYGNQDVKRWQLAADAAKAALDAAPAGAFALITDKGVDKNYKFAWEQNDNAEIVLAEKAYGARSRTQFPWYGLQPFAVISSWGGVTVTHNFVQKYEKKDGTPQTWDPAGGNDLNKKYAELDPRFAQTVGFNGSLYNRDVPLLETFQGGRHVSGCKGGAWLKKFMPDALGNNSNVVPNGIVFRLAEAYLTYAEALNEAQGPVPAAYDAVNAIRRRSGMPNLPAGLTQAQFRQRVRNERDIELAFEDHRLYDIRRWKIAEQAGVMQGDMQGIRVFRITGSTEFRYEPYVFETRTFFPKMYLHPFANPEVFKGYLVQNPGY